MDDLIGFLRARLDDDESAALAWLPFGNPDAAARGHIARHDPAWVLADVAAKRAIIETCAESLTLQETGYYEDHTGERDLANFVLHRLAQPYADHPDFKAEWRT
jgi:hypothetical protein